MFKLIIEKIKYLKGIPIELTERAIMSGQLRKGAVVGLVGHCWERSDEPALMEVRLTSDIQAGLMHPGLSLDLHGQGDVYWIDPLQRPPSHPPTKNSNKRALEQIRLRPGPH